MCIWNCDLLTSEPFRNASSQTLFFLRSRLVCGELFADGLSAGFFPLLTHSTDSWWCLEKAIFLKNFSNLITLWWQLGQIYEGRPSSLTVFNSKNLSRTEIIFSFDAFAPNKSKGWFRTTIFSLHVRQTRVATFVGVFSVSAIFCLLQGKPRVPFDFRL